MHPEFVLQCLCLSGKYWHSEELRPFPIRKLLLMEVGPQMLVTFQPHPSLPLRVIAVQCAIPPACTGLLLSLRCDAWKVCQHLAHLFLSHQSLPTGPGKLHHRCSGRLQTATVGQPPFANRFVSHTRRSIQAHVRKCCQGRLVGFRAATCARREGTRKAECAMTMMFCPSCANLLRVGKSHLGLECFCPTCPYTYEIIEPVVSTVRLKQKAVDDVLGGEEAWKNVDKTDATCPKCSHGKAYFMQIQTRSADEPASLFYKCVNCGEQWREG
mmetsp:Transcript_8233/g.51259  ORF Transcript_8233/g.51259 Transcript_8233/m.51259 type:complete len:270 (-) Transcript_8233:1451-2260(-)